MDLNREDIILSYINGKNVLPKELLEEIQKYVEGEIIYIPKKSKKISWGEKSGYRKELNERNSKMVSLFNSGLSINKLSTLYCLSEDSVRKIVFKACK